MNSAKLFVISAPSGGGKTSIVKAILEKHPEFLFSISATTRAMRAGEIDGKDYFFLRKEDFETKIQQGELVEYEQLYNNYYGTLKRETDRALHNGKSMLFDVDVKGGLSIKKVCGEQAVLIFIAPPSVEALEARLRNRKTEDEEKIQKRVARFPVELEIGKQFDYTVVNDVLTQAIDDVLKIIEHTLQLK